MKIIMSTVAVFPFHGYGGIEKYPYYLSKYLAREGVDVEIVTSRDKNERDSEIYEGIRYVFLPPRVRWRRLAGPWFYMYCMNLSRYLSKQECDVVHTYSSTPCVYLRRKERRPTVVQPFAYMPFTHPSYLNEKPHVKVYNDLMLRHPARVSITNADAIASEGDFQLDELKSLFGIDEKKIFSLPIGVDLQYIRENTRDQKISRSELGLSDDDFVLISVNRFLPDKGIGYLVDAFASIRKEIPSARLILVGGVKRAWEETEHDRIMKKIGGLDKDVRDSILVRTNVSEDQLYGYYMLSDLYVSPTFHNDFVMSIQEAMACGLPVVSTGQDFLVKENVNGFVVPKKDPEAIAEAVKTVYDRDLCNRMGGMSRELIKEFDWPAIAKKVIKEYEKLISN